MELLTVWFSFPRTQHFPIFLPLQNKARGHLLLFPGGFWRGSENRTLYQIMSLASFCILHYNNVGTSGYNSELALTKRHPCWSIHWILERLLVLKVTSSMWSALGPALPLCPRWFIINTSAYLLQQPEFAKQPWLIGYWRPHSASSSTNNHSHTRLLSAHLSSTSANSVWAACW